MEHLDQFCQQVATGLYGMTFEDRQQLLRLVVERVTVEDGVARIETVIPLENANLRNRRQDERNRLLPIDGFPVRGELVEPFSQLVPA